MCIAGGEYIYTHALGYGNWALMRDFTRSGVRKNLEYGAICNIAL